MKDLNKILIVQTASIGDVILSTPIIEKLHHFYPEAKIDILVKRGNEPVFYGHPILDEVIIWDKSEHKYRNLFDVINVIREQKYDLLVNLQRFATSGFLTVYSKARYKIGFRKNPFSFLFNKRILHIIGDRKQDTHEIDRNLKLVEALTDNSRFSVKLHPTKANDARTSQYKTHEYICIAPASLWFTKQFPESRWVEFIKQLDSNLHIYFIGAPTDQELCSIIIEKSRHLNSINLAGKMSLLESASLMRDAKMNFVNDSAPLHLASSVNAPVTAIFCSTVPEFGFGPLSLNSSIIEPKEELNCRPCGLHGYIKCPERHFKCATTIEIKELLNRL